MHYLTIGSQQLEPLSIRHKAWFDCALKKSNIPLSDYTFANNFIWLSMVSGFVAEIEECLCLFALTGETLTMMLPPIGSEQQQRSALNASFELMDRYNESAFLGKIEFVYKDFLNILDQDKDVPLPLAGGDRWLVEPGNPDYIYRSEDLINLNGNRYRDKRNLINQFRRSFPECRTEPMHAGHHAQALELTHNWMSHRLKYIPPQEIEHSVYFMELERTAIHRALKYFDQLALCGLCLFNGDEMLGFTIGERINSNVASVLIEKTNIEVLGCAQYLFREFSKQFADCEFINVGDDLGLENLRRVKMSYRPALLGEKYTLRRFTALGDD